MPRQRQHDAQAIDWYKFKYGVHVVLTDAPISDMRYQATWGDYDLDCSVAWGKDYMEAIWELNGYKDLGELDMVQ